MDFNQQINFLKMTIRNQSFIRTQHPSVKFISSEVQNKWRAIMIQELNKLRQSNMFDKNLIADLKMIIRKIPDQKFVQTILKIQPFKPKFQISSIRSSGASKKSIMESQSGIEFLPVTTKLLKDEKINVRGSILKIKMSVQNKINDSLSELEGPRKHKKSMMETIINFFTHEETLVKEFQLKSHPFKKIVEGFIYIFQKKFQNIVEKMASSKKQQFSMEKIQQLMICDLTVLEQFIVKASKPYLSIIKSQNPQEKIAFKEKMNSFLRQYIQKHQKINQSIRKVLRHATRCSPKMKKLMKMLPDFTQIQKFQLPPVFKIDGCYIQAMNSLMEFSETYSSKQSLYKLSEFRQSIARDVDDYYKNTEINPKRQMGSQTQLQILKFILVKLKSWICQIYAQLNYLEIVFGQNQMSYKYDDASYMHAQIMMALQILEMDNQ